MSEKLNKKSLVDYAAREKGIMVSMLTENTDYVDMLLGGVASDA